MPHIALTILTLNALLNTSRGVEYIPELNAILNYKGRELTEERIRIFVFMSELRSQQEKVNEQPQLDAKLLNRLVGNMRQMRRGVNNNNIICIDLHTGEIRWEHDSIELGHAHFEWYEDGIVAYPHYRGDDFSNPIFLESANGKAHKSFQRDPKRLLAKSSVFYPGPKVELDNGWRLTGFSTGNDRTLVFCDDRDVIQWQIQTDGYPSEVRDWKNFVFFAYSYLTDEAILYAYRAGEETHAWTLDVNQIVKNRQEPLKRMIFQVIEDRVYVESNEHIFCVLPATGELLWHRDLAKELDLKFDPDFYAGGLNLAVFAKSENVLVISFERRVLALDLGTGRYLWHLEPDTFPHCPFPVVYGDRVILAAGVNRVLHRLSSGENK